MCVVCASVSVPGPQYTGDSFFYSLGTQVWLCQCLLRDRASLACSLGLSRLICRRRSRLMSLLALIPSCLGVLLPDSTQFCFPWPGWVPVLPRSSYLVQSYENQEQQQQPPDSAQHVEIEHLFLIYKFNLHDNLWERRDRNAGRKLFPSWMRRVNLASDPRS